MTEFLWKGNPFVHELIVAPRNHLGFAEPVRVFRDDRGRLVVGELDQVTDNVFCNFLELDARQYRPVDIRHRLQCLDLPVQATGHVIERIGQMLEFVAGAYARSRLQITIGKLPGKNRQAL